MVSDPVVGLDGTVGDAESPPDQEGAAPTNAIQMADQSQSKATGTRRCGLSIHTSQTEANATWIGRKMKPWRRAAR